ncbi:MAG: CPBP family intramembrane glutamic endopeptidase [Marinifilaceae bacterium]
MRDKKFDRKIFRIRRNYPWREFLWKGLIFLFFTSAWVYFYRSDVFFQLPRSNFQIWLLVMVSYPLWSAYTQEVIFRVFFFHRYKQLFSNDYAMLIANAFLFAMAHIIFRNLVALTFTFFGSLLLSLTYLRNKSLNAAFLEHSIYGNILFTNGLGVYFYLPFG